MFLLISFLLLLGLASPALAQGPQVVEERVVADFPSSIAFKLVARGESPLTRAVLRYQLERESCFEEVIERHPSFTLAPGVEVRWFWDMRKSGGLPPGAGLVYEWMLTDTQGNKGGTLPRPFRFQDARFPWQSLAGGGVTLYWHDGGEAFARRLLEASVKAMERLQASAGVVLPGREGRGAQAYIYNSSEALRGARVFPQPWEGGVAFPDYGIVALGVAPNQVAWGERAVAHELAHVAVFDTSNTCYADIPPWLNEGLAMFAEGKLESNFASRLQKAIQENRLISLRSLSSGFPLDAEAALLSYAQSHSLVDFLVRSYGPEKMRHLLEAIGQGYTPDQALLQVYGFDSRGLEGRWRQEIGSALPATPGSSPLPADPPTFSPSLSWGKALVLLGIVLLLGLSFLPKRWRK